MINFKGAFTVMSNRLIFDVYRLVPCGAGYDYDWTDRFAAGFSTYLYLHVYTLSQQEQDSHCSGYRLLPLWYVHRGIVVQYVFILTSVLID